MRSRTTWAVAALIAAGAQLSRPAISAHAEEEQSQPGVISGTALTPAQLAERMIHRRAVEAVIRGMPAVNFDLMYQAMIRDARAGAGAAQGLLASATPVRPGISRSSF